MCVRVCIAAYTYNPSAENTETVRSLGLASQPASASPSLSSRTARGPVSNKENGSRRPRTNTQGCPLGCTTHAHLHTERKKTQSRFADQGAPGNSRVHLGATPSPEQKGLSALGHLPPGSGQRLMVNSHEWYSHSSSSVLLNDRLAVLLRCPCGGGDATCQPQGRAQKGVSCRMPAAVHSRKACHW